MERVLATVSVTLSAVLLASPAAAQRLPHTAQPIHYDITIAPDLAAARFSGQVQRPGADSRAAHETDERHRPERRRDRVP